MEMTLEEKMGLLKQLSEEYDEEGADFDSIMQRAEEVHLEEVDFIYDKEHERGELFICPDTEWEFSVAFEIAKEHMWRATEVICDAIRLYYRESFWSDVMALDHEGLAKIYTRLHNIPIIRFFSFTEVKLLNTRKLNADM